MSFAGRSRVVHGLRECHHGLLAGQNASAAAIEEVEGDGRAFIFIPYAGRIGAAGNTLPGAGAESSPATSTNRPPIRRSSCAAPPRRIDCDRHRRGARRELPDPAAARTLSGMLAAAGGSQSRRDRTSDAGAGNERGRLWFQDLFPRPPRRHRAAQRRPHPCRVRQPPLHRYGGHRHPDGRALREPGDLGVEGQSFGRAASTPRLRSDRRVSCWRPNDPEEIARAVLAATIWWGQRMLSLRPRPDRANSGMFEARDFVIREQDTVYVTEAPITQWNNAIRALTGTLGRANTVANAGGRLTRSWPDQRPGPAAAARLSLQRGVPDNARPAHLAAVGVRPEAGQTGAGDDVLSGVIPLPRGAETVGRRPARIWCGSRTRSCARSTPDRSGAPRWG